MSAHSRWRLVASYAVGVWRGLTAWAALAQCVLPGRGHALGQLGWFHWVLLIVDGDSTIFLREKA